MSAEDLSSAVARAHLLPRRQRQVLECLARGLLVKETASELSVAENTVKHTRTLVYRRLGVSNSVEATRVACQAGIV